MTRELEYVASSRKDLGKMPHEVKKDGRRKNKITKSSGNVFEDLNFPDAQEVSAKSKLATAIYLIIKSRRLTQKEAASIMGTDQPHVSDIIRGKLSKFTIDRLLKFLLALGQDNRN